MMRPPGTVCWGILGTGRVAHDFAQGLRILPNAELVAVASRTPSTADAFAHAMQPRRVYGSYEQLVQDDEIDVVFVATPHHRHADDSMLCLDHGKAVLCEKPFAIDANGARKVIALARRKRLFCMEAMWMRFFPLMPRIRSMVQDGVVGEALMLTADFGVPNVVDPSSRLFDVAMGGGALLDRGVYPLSLASMLFGPPSAVASHASIGKTGVDEQTTILLNYSHGPLAMLSASLRSYSSNQATIMGTRGSIRIHAPFYAPRRVSISTFAEPGLTSGHAGGWREQLKQRARASQTVRRISPSVKSLLVRGKTIAMEPQGNGYNYEAAEVIRCLLAGALESPIMPLDETLQIVETMDHIRAQWQSAAS